MSLIIDFPTNYEEKLKQADQLIDKGYIDQAICVIEDFIEESHPVKGKELLQKKILTCFFMKKEFESAKNLLNELTLDFYDLSILAHRVLLYRFEQDEKGLSEIETQSKVNLSLFAYKNLNELIAQLKTFYEEYWFYTLQKQIQQLNKNCTFEQKLFILSDLQQYEVEDLSQFQKEFIMFFESEQSPILKTILFELIAKKELNWHISFQDESSGLTCLLSTNSTTLDPFSHEIENATALIRKLEIDHEVKDGLIQQVSLFYQFCFPFYQQLELEVVIEMLLGLIGERNHGFLDQNDSSSTNSPIINYTTCKLSQYILSLSSLM